MKYTLYAWLMIVVSMQMLWGMENGIARQSIPKSILIVKSTKNYTEAKKVAENLAKQSSLKLDLRELVYNAEIMLSESDSTCIENGFEYPCYVARGRYDDGIYLSVESSDAYEGFISGYYIVVAASMKKIPRDILAGIKQYVSDAYIKKTAVYMGCIH